MSVGTQRCIHDGSYGYDSTRVTLVSNLSMYDRFHVICPCLLQISTAQFRMTLGHLFNIAVHNSNPNVDVIKCAKGLVKITLRK